MMKSIDTTDVSLGDLSDRVWRLFLITWGPQVFVATRDYFVFDDQPGR